MWLTLLFACQAPFGMARQDLAGFRVAALTVTAGQAGDPVSADVAVIVKGRPWSDAPVALRWHWVAPTDDAVRALTPNTPADATGAQPPLVRPSHDARLALVAVAPDGSVARAFADPPLTTPQWQLQGVSFAALPWTLEGLQDEDLIDREAVETLPTSTVEADGFLRFTATVSGSSANQVTMRWMATAGSWLELSTDTADWTPGVLKLDSGEIEQTQVGLDGPVTIVALALDGSGGGSFRGLDLWVGTEPHGIRIDNRWLNAELPSGRVRATLSADDASPTGLRLTNPELVGEDTAQDSLPCTESPFHPDLLLRQVCARTDVIGARIIVDVP